MALREMPCACASCLKFASHWSNEPEVRHGAAAKACVAASIATPVARANWKRFITHPKVVDPSMRLRLQCLFGQLIQRAELGPRQPGRGRLDIRIDLVGPRGPRDHAGNKRFFQQPRERNVEHVELVLLAEL